MKRFFWFCAGADANILKKCPTSEHIKYAGLGATVLLTAMLASLSGGYALYTSFGEANWAILFGIFWGLVIFNLDRMIVSSMRKESNAGYSRREFSMAFPRLVLSLFIAIIVAKPLELKIFEKDLDRQLAEDQKNKLFALDNEFIGTASNLKAVLDTATIQQKRRLDEVRISKPAGIENIEQGLKEANEALSKKESEINSLRVSLSAVQADINSLGTTRKQLQAEITVLNDSINAYASRNRQDKVGAFASRRDALRGQVDRVQRNLSPKVTERNNLKESINTLEQERSELRSSTTGLQNQKKSLLDEHYTTIRQRETEFKKFETMNEGKKDSIDVKKNLDLSTARKPYEVYQGFYVRLEAMRNLEDKYFTIWLASWFLMLLFVTLETAPVVIKLLMPHGGYEREYELREYENYTRSQKTISAINDGVNHELRTEAHRNQTRHELELASSEKVLQRATQAQERIALLIIRKWEEREAQKVESDFEQYLRTSPFASEREDGRARAFANERDNSANADARYDFGEEVNHSGVDFSASDGANQANASGHNDSQPSDYTADYHAPPHSAPSPDEDETRDGASAPASNRPANERALTLARTNSMSESETDFQRMLRRWYEQIKNLNQ